MSAATAAAWLLAPALTAACTLAARAVALRAGLVDDARDAPERKAHRAPVALVGGVAIAAALGLLLALGALVPALRFETWSLEPAWTPLGRGAVAGLGAVLPALGAALLVGLADDLAPRGLAPLPKLAGQLLAGLVLAWCLARATPAFGAGHAALAVLGTVVATNALNTFDNADGAATSLAGGALALAGSALGALVLGFLPLNLLRVRGRPLAWLGDAGSHLLGVLVLVHPLAWPALWLPLLDLARVAWLRARAGEAPWRGDRRHLAHRMEARGRSRAALLAWLAAIGLAPVAGWIAAQAPERGWAWPAALALSTALFAACLALHPAEPCPPGGRVR